MHDIAVSVNGLSKQYRLGEIGTGTLSHDLNRWWHRIRGKEDPYKTVGDVNDRTIVGDLEYVWALQDITFEVNEGEVIGIIGKNGAGKSTLLKLLSKVTGPTHGRIKMEGRVASLLEVGTGFHNELTGRENIYLNGAILGMTRQEVTAKLDAIVEFAGVSKYLDTPVKRYSSGMTVRLGFAVAAHLEPEILIVDEVLAVGDAEFQQKAIGKMQDVAQGGERTVLFVSHNMTSVRNLCSRSILLENGRLVMNGNTDEVVDAYLERSASQTDANNLIPEKHPRNGALNIMFREIYVNGNGLRSEGFNSSIKSGDDVTIRMVLENKRVHESKNVLLAMRIDDAQEMRVTFLSNEVLKKELRMKPGTNTIDFHIPKFNLNSGRYFITIFISEHGIIEDWIQKVIYFDIENADFYGTGATIDHQQGRMLFNFELNHSY